MEFYQPENHTDAELTERVNAPGRHIVFLQTGWCGDCKAIKPFVGQLREQAEATGADWIDADRDRNLEFAREHGLQGIPAFVLFENGQAVDHVGDGQLVPPVVAQDWLKRTLA